VLYGKASDDFYSLFTVFVRGHAASELLIIAGMRFHGLCMADNVSRHTAVEAGYCGKKGASHYLISPLLPKHSISISVGKKLTT
jgi:hypothetical protein